MNLSFAVFLLMLPFLGIVVYASWHEYDRFKRDGKANYGLTYDPETNTTFVAAIPEGEDSYDLDEFDPTESETAQDVAEEDRDPDLDPDTEKTAQANPDDTEQDKRS